MTATRAAKPLTEDGFLGGRVRLLQPRAGYRAATDPVFLAAACPARPGDCVLDLGCGAGAAALCLAARTPGLVLHGLEIQPDYADLARRNAALNGIAFEVVEGDLRAMPEALRALSFDHVVANPPFFGADATPSPVAGRDRANRAAESELGDWIDAGLRRLRPGGSFTLIHRAEGAPAVLAALDGRAGDIRLLPLAPRKGRPARRVLIGARKGARAPFTLLAPFVVHAGAAHAADGEDYSPQAAAVLREGAGIDLYST